MFQLPRLLLQQQNWSLQTTILHSYRDKSGPLAQLKSTKAPRCIFLRWMLRFVTRLRRHVTVKFVRNFHAYLWCRMNFISGFLQQKLSSHTKGSHESMEWHCVQLYDWQWWRDLRGSRVGSARRLRSRSWSIEFSELIVNLTKHLQPT